MPKSGENLCGFAVVIYHHSTRGKQEFETAQQCLPAGLRMPYRVWSKRNPERRRMLRNRNSYVGQDREESRDTFLKHFSLDNWMSLTESEKDAHTLTQCHSCFDNHETCFLLLEKNNKSVHKLQQSNILVTKKATTPSVSAAIKQNNETTPSQPTRTKTQTKKTKTILSKLLKREVIRDAQKYESQVRLEKDFNAVYCYNESLSGWDRKRKASSGELIIRKKPACHVGHLKAYAFDRSALLADLHSKPLPLSQSLHRQWTAIGRKHNITLKETGLVPSNVNQVVQKFAMACGFDVSVTKRKRISYRNHPELKLNVPVATSAFKIRQLKNQKIASGEIDCGEPMVGIRFKETKVLPNGELYEKIDVVHGRKFYLAKLREEHLHHMDKLGLLRKDNSVLTPSEVQQKLSSYGIQPHGDHIDQQAQLKNVEATRCFTVWHDHSDIVGSSHYLFMVWFNYDAAVYLTDEEWKRPGTVAQVVVEQPYVYAIARSTSSVKDQLLYIPTRNEDLLDTHTPIFLNSKEYKDLPRFFTGDGPARQLELGQSMGGNFPCGCGASALDFGNPRKFLKPSIFNSIQERLAHINASDTWKRGFGTGDIEPFDKLNANQLVNELGLRDVNLTYDESVTEMRTLLKKAMRGVKRPAAVLCSDKSLPEINSMMYDVALTEPLHDLKNVISRIFEDIPSVISDKEIKNELGKHMKALQGNRTVLSGFLTRRNLIRLVKVLEDVKFQTDKTCQKLYRMLSALVEVQHIAYTLEKMRNPKQVLRCYNRTFIFAMLYTELFASAHNQKLKNSDRSLFGMPFHCLSVHLPELLRIINLRSIVAEKAERHFGLLRKMSNDTSSRRPNDVILNAIIRLDCRRKHGVRVAAMYDSQESELQREALPLLYKSSISEEAAGLAQRGNTIFTRNFIEQQPLAFTHHLSRISDYIQYGDDYWYKALDNGAIMFYDGPNEPEQRDGPVLQHFRSTTMKDVTEKLQDCWQFCLKHPRMLNIEAISNLTAKNVLTDCATDSGFDKDLEMQSCEPVVDITILPSLFDDSQQSQKCTSEISASNVTNENPIATIPELMADDPYAFTDQTHSLTTPVPSKEPEKVSLLREILKMHFSNERISDFLKTRQEYKENLQNAWFKKEYAKSMARFEPKLKSIETGLLKKVREKEVAAFKSTATLAMNTAPQIEQLMQRVQVCRHYRRRIH